MPTYDYLCDECGHGFELFQPMTAPVKRKCPECGTMKLKRQIGPGAGVIFKGGGFYQTDYRSDSYRKAADAESKAAAGDPGTEKKPDASGAKKESPASDTEAASSPGRKAKSKSAKKSR